MSNYLILSLLFFTLSLLSLWIRRDPKIWGTFLAISLGFGMLSGVILWEGLAIAAGWALLWILYPTRPSFLQVVFFLAIVILSYGFKFHYFPGYKPFFVTPKFMIGFDSPLVGVFPIALLVPLARGWKDWGKVCLGLFWGCVGIAILAGLAIASGAIHWQYKLPSFAGARYWANLFLTAIPEEGFYRGFVQRQLCEYLGDKKGGKWIALFLSSFLFTLAHIYWSPSIAMLAFVFLAGLLYGGVYLISGKIESAILCHFLLNILHMTFFSYHAM